MLILKVNCYVSPPFASQNFCMTVNMIFAVGWTTNKGLKKCFKPQRTCSLSYLYPQFKIWFIAYISIQNLCVEIFCETVKGLNPGFEGLTDGQPVTSQLNWPIRSITRVQHHQLTWYNSLWLWRWLTYRLLKCQSLSTTTVLFRTMFTRTIILNLLINFLWLTSTVTVTLWELTCYKAYYW